MLLPGFLEMVYWLLHCRSEPCKTIFLWVLFFGPFTFPIAIIVWHFYNVVVGKVRENRSMSVVLTGLQSQTESAVQLVLQTRIMMITWTSFGNNWLQLASALSSLVMLSKVCKDHHYYDLSGKTELPRNHKTIFPFLIYLITIASRTFVIALCIAYARFWSMVPLFVFLVLTGLTAHCCLKTNRGKNLWTTFTSVLAPVCYVAKDDVKRLPDPPKRFYVYYMLNSLWFLTVGVGTAFAIYFGLEKSIIGLSGYGCDYTPFLSCFPKELQCNSTRIPVCMGDEYEHGGFTIKGTSSIGALSLLQFLFTSFLHNKCTEVSDYGMIQV